MSLVQVEILGTVITSQYGSLTAGDTLRTGADFAHHLVEECKVARYVQPQPAKKTPAKAKKAPPVAT